MTNFQKILAAVFLIATPTVAPTIRAQVDLPQTAPTAANATAEDADSAKPAVSEADAPLSLQASLGARIITVMAGNNKIKTYSVAVGQDRYPTPLGTFKIERIVWNPSWHPPDSKWAKGKTTKGPGDPGNPMKVVKIFFHDPDYYIHGTDDVDSLGDAASHGCLRMAPDEVADLAKLIMEHGGQPRDENWFWRILHSRRQEKVVYLDNPIPLTITE
jgi:lipoprotein-anchoring transpeptidase ErfK/SrfK